MVGAPLMWRRCAVDNLRVLTAAPLSFGDAATVATYAAPLAAVGASVIFKFVRNLLASEAWASQQNKIKKFVPAVKQALTRGIVIASALVLLAALLITAGYNPTEFWRAAVPGYLTGVGTLALAVVTFQLLMREDEQRESTAEALQHSQSIALDSARQRRDQRAPTLRITPFDQTHVLSDVSGHGGLRATIDGQKYPTNEASIRSITIRRQFFIATVDGSSVTVRLSGLTAEARERPGDRQIAIDGPGETLTFDTTRTVAEWIDLYRTRQNGDPGAEGHASIGVSDQFDDGVIDLYTFRSSGCPIVPVDDGSALWIVDTSPKDGLPRVAVEVRPVQRTYWRSKIRDEPLPENLDFQY